MTDIKTIVVICGIGWQIITQALYVPGEYSTHHTWGEGKRKARSKEVTAKTTSAPGFNPGGARYGFLSFGGKVIGAGNGVFSG